MKKKMILDIIMTVIILLLMKLAFTGITLHEILGLGVFVLFFVHNLFNRKWIKGITLKLFSDRMPTKTKLMYGLNCLLLIFVTFTIISGVLISQVLFPEFNAVDLSLWSSLHHFAAYSSLVLISVHIGLHWQSIMNMVKKLFKLSERNKIRTVVCRCLSVAIIFFGAKVLIREDISKNFSAPFAAKKDDSAAEIISATSNQSNVKVTQLSSTTQIANNAPTLDDYLSKLVCNGCGRHCPLTALKCSRGISYRDAATEEYNAKYAVSAQSGTSSNTQKSENDDSPSASENNTASGNDDSPSASESNSANQTAPLDFVLLMGLFVAGTHYVITIPKLLSK